MARLRYLSGSTGMAPEDVARATNSSAFDHIGPYSGKRDLGTIIMDFPGERLIYRVVKSNFTGSGSCNAQTFRTQSDHSWVEFRMPVRTEGTIISITGGSYNHYVFPKCNRVRWSDSDFACTSQGWRRTEGDSDADGYCTSNPGSSPYVVVGDR